MCLFLSNNIYYIGDNVKKYSIIFISCMLFVFAICLCVYMRDKYELMTYEINTDSFVYEYTEDDLKKKMDMDVQWLKEYKVLSSLSNLEYERILLFHVQEGYMEEVKQKADVYIEALKQQFANEAEEMTKQTKKFEKGDNYIIVVSKNADTIMKKLKERLME